MFFETEQGFRLVGRMREKIQAPPALGSCRSRATARAVELNLVEFSEDVKGNVV